jgi:hypothetical protein
MTERTPFRSGGLGRRRSARLAPASVVLRKARYPRLRSPSITTAHELNGATLLRLWDEVRTFWQGRDMKRTTSSFHNR